MPKRSSGGAHGADPIRDVTLARIEDAAAGFGFSCHVRDDRLIFPWRDHVLVAYLPAREDAGSPTSLVFESTLRQRIEMAQINEIAAAINEWNHQRLGPTLSLRLAGDGDELEVEIHARTAVLTAEGLSDEQLVEIVGLSVETTVLAVGEVLGGFPQLSTPDTPEAERLRLRQDSAAARSSVPGRWRSGADSAGADTPSPQSMHPSQGGPRISEHAPLALTTERIRDALGSAGITRTRADDEVIIAWINGILFGFFLDNGPSYLVKGHWDPSLDPDSDFLRIFLLCNDWNEDSLTTKAYSLADDDGLQVRVEFTTPVGEGLTTAQLEHNTTIAINQILHAVDSISTEATGSSAVEWP